MGSGVFWSMGGVNRRLGLTLGAAAALGEGIYFLDCYNLKDWRDVACTITTRSSSSGDKFVLYVNGDIEDKTGHEDGLDRVPGGRVL